MKLIVHQGLGDHFVCNGLIRTFCNVPAHVELILQEKNSPTLMFMFRDLKNLTYIIHEHYGITIDYMKENNDIFKVGFDYRGSEMTFDKWFYESAGIDFKKRFSEYYVERDYEREKEFSKKFEIDGDYIFLHEGGSSGSSIIDRDKIEFKLPIIKAEIGLTDNIFDYSSIIENAKEVHCVDSSFLFLIDSLNNKGKLFSHRYTKYLSSFDTPTLKSEWNILK